jgi:hypothetical protein
MGQVYITVVAIMFLIIINGSVEMTLDNTYVPAFSEGARSDVFSYAGRAGWHKWKTRDEHVV